MSKLLFQDNDAGSDYQAWFVEVILPVAVQGTFTYRVPSDFNEKTRVGQRIVVQFGKKKIYTALIVQKHQIPPKGYTAKYFLEILDEEPIVSETQLRFWEWIAAYYCCTLGEVMDAALPANMKLESESKITLHPEAELSQHPVTDKEAIILHTLRAEKVLTIGRISEILDQKTVLPLVKSMYEKGLIVLKEELTETYRIKTETFVSHAIELEDPDVRQELFQILEPAPKQSDLLLTYVGLLREGKPILKRKLLKTANAPASSLQALEEKGILSTYDAEVDRVIEEGATQAGFTLNEDQQRAIGEIKEAFTNHDVVLLHGVTGSGKTHVYMQLINEALEEGRQALYLVPEIVLTAQLIGRLRATYGEKIGIYHSKFSSDERMEIWNKVRNGTYQVVLGVRSALFLPFENLGLLVIDEEHEHTFKQFEPNPRYHARDAGIFLMSLMNGKTVLGTATPSFETYFNALRGKYGLVKMLRRWGDVMMPDMQIADLREEYRKKSMKSHFSSLLYTEMQKTLKTGGQVILFQNRRGYAPILECTTCGWIPMCQNCDISLTYHQATREVICHYCGYKEPSPKKCKACGNFSIKMLGFGTEKIEDELKIFFPEYNSLRMDQDTTRGKYAYAKIIQALEEGEAHILVGTQMVTKGLDFENVRVVGILSADQMLRFPDFRAVERSYQLMSQVAGRAGRRGVQGKVIIQTFNSPHPVFTFLLAHDYEGFYDYEIQERIDFKYPPFYKLIRLILRDENEEKVHKASHVLADSLRDIFGFRVLGPEAPPIARIRNKYAMNILLKFERQNMNMPDAKKTLMREIEQFKANKDFKGIRLVVDVDPY